MNQPDNIMEPGSAEWEALCRHCGRCCYEKLDCRGRIYYTDKPCQYLNGETKRCRIYRQRSELQPECAILTPELVAAGILPADCPYVAGIDNYRAPNMDPNKPQKFHWFLAIFLFSVLYF